MFKKLILYYGYKIYIFIKTKLLTKMEYCVMPKMLYKFQKWWSLLTLYKCYMFFFIVKKKEKEIK